MDPTNLLLIVALGSPNFHTRHQARSALEDQGIAAWSTLLTFEKHRDPEIAHSCKTLKDRATSKYVFCWAEKQQFLAMTYGKVVVSTIIADKYRAAAEACNHSWFAQDPYNVYRHATRLWAIDRLLCGEKWEKIIEELVGDDQLLATNYPED